MKLFSDWGFSLDGWRTGHRGEYWVIAQAVLLLGLVFLPVYRFPLTALPPIAQYFLWGLAALLGLLAIVLLGKGVFDLGISLTPLPYPRDDGQLVQSGVYGIVRHPIYSGVILGTLSFAIAQFSATHFVATIVFLLFFNAKAAQEEKWLCEKYPDYESYRDRVKKLLPWIF